MHSVCYFKKFSSLKLHAALCKVLKRCIFVVFFFLFSDFLVAARSINFNLNDFSSRYKLLHFKIAGIALKFSFVFFFFFFPAFFPQISGFGLYVYFLQLCDLLLVVVSTPFSLSIEIAHYFAYSSNCEILLIIIDIALLHMRAMHTA